MKNFLSFMLLSVVFFACSNNESQKSSAQKTLPYEVTENTSYKEVGSIKDLSYGSIKRIEALIAIPIGRSQEEVKETLSRAAYEIANREKPKALVVKAFSEEDQFKHGAYTAGEAIWAPNGKWEDADTESEYKITINLGKVYFETKGNSIPSKGDIITLTSRNGQNISISSKRDSWVDEDIIKKVSPGTKAQVIERYEEALTPDHKFVRYKIKIENTVGWVGEEDILK